MALRDLNVKIGADTSGFNRGLKDVKGGLSGFKGEASKASGGLSTMTKGFGSMLKAGLALAGITSVIKGLNDAFKAFITLESSMTRVNDMFGAASKYVTYFAENTARSFGMSQTAAYQFAATYGNLFRGITKDSAENSKVTIAMLKASAVVASKTGRTTEDVMERIRSGLLGNTESIEDLGINVNVAMLEVTDAFKRIANGRSWEKLTFYEQQQIRTLAILEQAHTSFGDSVQQGSAFSLQTLSGAFKDFVAAAGSFVNAGLQPIIKGLTQLFYWAAAGMKALAGLFGLKVETKDSEKQAAATGAQAGAQDSYNESLKETVKQKQKLAGFDEINTLAADDTGSGAAAGEGAGAGTGASVFDSIAMPEYKPNIDTSEIEKKFKKFRDEFKNTSIYKIFSDAIELAGTIIGKFKGIITDYYENFLKPLKDFTAPRFEKFLQNFSDKYGELTSMIKNSSAWEDIRTILKAVYKFLLPVYKLFIRIGDWFANFLLSAAFIEIKYLIKDIEDALGFVAAIIKGDFSDAWDHFKDLMVNNRIDKAKEKLDLLKEKFGEVKQALTTWAAHWKEKITEAVDAWKEKIKAWWDGHVAPWFTKEKWDGVLFEIGASFGRAVKGFIDFWKVKLPAWWKDDVKPWFTKEKWAGIYNNIKTAFAEKWAEVKTTANNKLSDFWNNTVKPWFTLEKWKTLGSNIKDGIVAGFKAAIAVIVSFINGIISVIESGINFVLGGIRKVLEGYNSIPMLGDVDLAPYADKKFGRIPAPKLATGGVIDSPTLAMVGESGKEAIMPLENNTGWIDKLAEKLNGSGSGDTVVNLKVYLDDGTLIDTIQQKIKRNAQRANGTVFA